MLPFEFTVPGPPISHQSRNKTKLSKWQQTVRTAASRGWGSRRPLSTHLIILVTYYHEGESVRIDADNMVKPIQDALIGVIYSDDRWITDAVVRKTSIDGLFRARRASKALLEAFRKGAEFLHVIVDYAPSHNEPLRGPHDKG